MARNVKGKSGVFSGAHVMQITRKDALPTVPKMNHKMPKVGDVIVYNVKTPFGDKRTKAIQKEERGCMVIKKIYPSFVIGERYKYMNDQNVPDQIPISLQVNDFKMGNVIFVKIKKPVCYNLFEYDDWTLKNETMDDISIELLHPNIRKNVI